MHDKKYYQKHIRLKREFRVTFTLSLAEVLGKKPLKVLDIGCGIGAYSEAVMKESHRVVSLDISKEAKSIERSVIEGS